MLLVLDLAFCVRTTSHMSSQFAAYVVLHMLFLLESRKGAPSSADFPVMIERINRMCAVERNFSSPGMNVWTH